MVLLPFQRQSSGRACVPPSTMDSWTSVSCASRGRGSNPLRPPSLKRMRRDLATRVFVGSPPETQPSQNGSPFFQWHFSPFFFVWGRGPPQKLNQTLAQWAPHTPIRRGWVLSNVAEPKQKGSPFFPWKSTGQGNRGKGCGHICRVINLDMFCNK